MRKLATGAAFAATTVCLSVAVSGIAGSTSPLGSGPFKLPSAAADELPAFENCGELLDWYVEKALPQVGPWGFGYPYIMYGGPFMLEDSIMTLSGAVPMPAAFNTVAARDTAEATGSSATGTNVQEAGIDEPDRAKTDGRLVFQIHERQLVVTDVSGDEPVELSRTPMPSKFNAENLLLVGDTVIVTATSYDYAPMGRMAADYYYGGVASSQIAVYDVGAPRNPVLVSEHSYEGTLVEARQYGDTVRLVLQHSGLPELDFVQPGRRRTERDATRENREILRNSTIDEWLPLAEHDGVEGPLVDCQDVRHPLTDSGLGTISVVTFQASDPSDDSAVAVTTSGSVAYSATDRLYVATPVMPEYRVEPWGLGNFREVAPPDAPARTEIHAFDLTADGTTYAASGTVQGMVKDRWSFDDHDGELRVATSLTKSWETTDNAVTVLRQDGGELRVLGSVRGLGPKEEIKSVRWFDDFAVVVTFRQTDPLYTVDLTNPADPKVLGELKIPGFSAYLHPIGDDRILGLGSSATNEGQVTGAQFATFDISDLRDPQQLDVLRMRDVDELTAAWDPHAFNFIGGHAFTIANSWAHKSNSRIIKLAVGADGGLTELTSYPSSYEARILPIEGGRVALVGDAIRIVAD
ncbi:MAG TPA: beta-propeller domain-containing protein [Nocardioidaceae bacterium]|nr:beta-propeller domain-containing protein [Nocardioidaceae bacterium]